MPIDKKYIRLNFASANQHRIPPCIQCVVLEVYGTSSMCQCLIPQSGGAGTTSTQCSKNLLSVNRGRSYARRTIKGVNASNKYWQMAASGNSTGYFYNNCINNGVRAAGSGGYSCPGNLVGDVTYLGGFHGRKYLTCSATISCGKGTTTAYGYVYGGWGGDAGPNGPGGNGSSAYTLTCYRTSTTYYPGAGGGANGGTNANTGTAGVSWWRCKSQGAGGDGGNRCTFSVGTTSYLLPLRYSSNTTAQITNTLQYVGGGNGGGRYYVIPTPTGNPNCGGCTSRRIAMGILSGCLGSGVPAGTTYYHIFSYQGVYQIVVPVGTTEIKVDALGGGASGNVASSASAPGFSTTTGVTAGGGGGAFARSTLVKDFTTPGSIIDVQVAGAKPRYSCPTYKSSKVSIDGVLEAEAFTAFDVRAGGCYINLGTGWGYNYARSGVTRYGGGGGRGYYSGTNLRGGGGGGAAWYGGNGGSGSSASSTRTSGAGGGAASCSGSGGGGGCSGSTTAGANGGSSGSGYPSYGGTPGQGVGTSPVYGVGGAGGAGGSSTNSTTRIVTGGSGGQSQYLSGNSAYAFNGYDYVCNFGNSVLCGVLFGYPYGPGGGGGGGYASSTLFGNAGRGGYFGGGGGGDWSSGGAGGPGLVIITITVNSSLTAAYAKVNTSTVHAQIIA